jgi:hypothetical protein
VVDRGGVVLGSGVRLPGQHLRTGNGGRAAGEAMACISNGWLVAGTADGTLIPLSTDRYRASASEVSAAFRLVDGVPQYVALVQ